MSSESSIFIILTIVCLSQNRLISLKKKKNKTGGMSLQWRSLWAWKNAQWNFPCLNRLDKLNVENLRLLH